MQSTGYSCHILMKLEISRQMFEKYTNIRLFEQSIQWEQTYYLEDGQTDVTQPTIAFRNFASAFQNTSSELQTKTNLLY
jgi:hypothetical protein